MITRSNRFSQICSDMRSFQDLLGIVQKFIPGPKVGDVKEIDDAGFANTLECQENLLRSSGPVRKLVTRMRLTMPVLRTHQCVKRICPKVLPRFENG